MNLKLLLFAAALSIASSIAQDNTPPPHVEALCGASFDAFKDVPQHVCCEAKACLDDVAFALQRQSDARLVIVGNATTLEKAATNQGYVSDLDARRAIVTKEYRVRQRH
jgi:hypothetical protein